MSNKLIIVESPTKVHTIKKFLGSGYEVIASNGHIRDLPKSTIGVDTEGDFEPKYITIRGKGEIVNALKKEIKKADKIYLATDPDREGEAISWHLKEGLDMSGKAVYRIAFNEITKNAVKEALKNPREIDMNLVDAQQARRILDRVVGYKLSPVLWKKIKGKLSAGRVQSAVLRMIADRENEIAAFEPQEYWTISGDFYKDGKKLLQADYYGVSGKKKALRSEKEAENVKKDTDGKEFTVKELKKSSRQKSAPLPFTTSTLQQEASLRLNFSTQKTMSVAQQLYEGVKVTGHGTIGLITYLRTDSTRISEEADRLLKAFVAEKYGEGFVGTGGVKNRSGAQDAHEAIRPTDITLTPESLKTQLTRDQLRLYQLIYKRFVASRMKAAIFDTASIKLACGKHEFTASQSKLGFPGYLLSYEEEDAGKSGEQGILKLQEGDTLLLSESAAEQHFTAPPAHYTEATLVRAMEELGLGRPSTYAPTITNILGRHYITKEGRNLFVTELGEAVNNMMCASFPDIVDLGFTAQMETSLDEVAEGKMDWHRMMKDFYPGFAAEIEKAENELEHVKVEDQVTEEICELCGRNMVIKYGKHGKFLACPGFPECRNTRTLLERTGIPCPNCGKEIVVRHTKKGRRFYGCEGAPDCDYMSWTKPKKN